MGRQRGGNSETKMEQEFAVTTASAVQQAVAADDPAAEKSE
jgi:hypothetical protein